MICVFTVQTKEHELGASNQIVGNTPVPLNGFNDSASIPSSTQHGRVSDIVCIKAALLHASHRQPPPVA